MALSQAPCASWDNYKRLLIKLRKIHPMHTAWIFFRSWRNIYEKGFLLLGVIGKWKQNSMQKAGLYSVTLIPSCHNPSKIWKLVTLLETELGSFDSPDGRINRQAQTCKYPTVHNTSKFSCPGEGEKSIPLMKWNESQYNHIFFLSSTFIEAYVTFSHLMSHV